VGGPIIRDKTFFFFSYAGLRQVTNTFLSGARVPTALERIGNFTQSSGSGPRDPATNATFVCNGVQRVICPNRIDPVAARIINDYIPLPNLPGNLWQGNVPNPFNSDEFLVKVDHQLNEPHRLTFSYFNTAGNTTVFPGSGNVPWATQNFKWRQHNLNISDVWVVSGDKINQLWLTYTRNYGGRNNEPAISLRDLGSAFTPQGAPSLPQITVTGFFTLSNAIGGPTAGTDLYSIRDVFSWNKGRHSLKFGAELSLNKDTQDTLLNNYGVWGFNNAGATSNALANFLIGIPTSLTQDAPVTAYTNSWYTALFLQDDFRVNQRLTLNLGLRWDMQTPPTDPLNRVMNYVPGQRSVVNPIAPPGPLFYGDPGVERAGIPGDYDHFSPRVGFAWDPFGNGKTSIRAAAGLFWGSISGNEWNTMTNFQPYATRLTFPNVLATTSPAGVPNGASLRNPYNNFPGGNPFPYTGAFTTGGGLFAVAPDFTWPRTFQMNVSVQREILKDLTLGVAYVETISSHLPFGRDVNYPLITATATTAANNVLARRPNPAFGAVTVLDSDQEANYHGLQLTGNYRLGRRVSINGFYTLSKTWSSVQLHNNTTQGLAQNFTRLGLENGRADTDQRHVLSISGNIVPDFYRGDNRIMKAIINGWSLSPILRMRSGRPFTVTNGNVDANLDGQTNDRARVIGDPHLDNPTADMWFNIFAFAQNAAVTGVAREGDAPRNFLTGPSYKAVDVAASRDFRFGERYKLRVRVEGTNIFNMVNYDQPNASTPANPATSTTFGRITSAGPMRKLQFGARFTF
jgi:outer membrane receptor protein involved in Fe transport